MVACGAVGRARAVARKQRLTKNCNDKKITIDENNFDLNIFALIEKKTSFKSVFRRVATCTISLY